MKNSMRFATGLIGYKKRDVDRFIDDERERLNDEQLAMRNAIKELKAENDKCKMQIKEYETRENSIKQVLLSVSENAKKQSEEIVEKYTIELKRLQLFRAKWLNAYEELKSRYHFEKDALNMEAVAVSCELELKNFLKNEFSLSKIDSDNSMENYYRKEVERLTNLCAKDTKSMGREDIIDRLNKVAKISNDSDKNSFSLDDAINPIESLEDICKSLGIVGKL